jgi:FkbM family methyltransferase
MNNFSNVIIEKIVDLKKKNVVVFDVGSFQGNFSRTLKNKLLKEKISANFYLFDPNPNIKLKDFFTENIALSSKKGEKIFYLNNFLPSSGSSLKNIVANDKLWNISRRVLTLGLKKNFSQIGVITDTIDNFCKKKKIKQINVLKIDVEGSEFEVIQGAKKQLESTEIILLEILEKKNCYDEKFQKIFKLLTKKYGFKLLKKKEIFSTKIFSH